MEIANLQLALRQAVPADSGAIADLLQSTPYTHVHVDWRLPGDWLGTPGFLVAETTGDHILGAGVMQGCLAVGADPTPAAWVRVAAVRSREGAVPLLVTMLESMQPYLTEQGVTQLGWLPRTGWPEEWLRAMRFEKVDEVITYIKPDLSFPEDVSQNETVRVRAVRREDLPQLAAIEKDAFEPLWRHSMEGLALGWRHSTAFDVAELNGELVGFQYSAASDIQNAGHLVRLTVSPAVQRSGVGSALLVAALNGYRRQNLQEASLNTQSSNQPSRRLYEKFGFELAHYRWPVWRIFIS